MISPVNLKNHETEDLLSDRIVKKWFQVKIKQFFLYNRKNQKRDWEKMN